MSTLHCIWLCTKRSVDVFFMYFPDMQTRFNKPKRHKKTACDVRDSKMLSVFKHSILLVEKLGTLVLLQDSCSRKFGVMHPLIIAQRWTSSRSKLFNMPSFYEAQSRFSQSAYMPFEGIQVGSRNC